MTTRAVSNKEGEMGDGGTVKVRVWVGVSEEGTWFAAASSDESDEDARGVIYQQDLDVKKLYVLTAELPIPRPAAPQEVAAGVDSDG